MTSPTTIDGAVMLTDEKINTISETYAKRWRSSGAWNTKRCIQNALIDARALLSASEPAAPREDAVERIRKVINQGFQPSVSDCRTLLAAFDAAAAPAQSAEAEAEAEAVAEIVSSHFVEGGTAVKLLYQSLPVGAKLYIAPQPAQPAKAGEAHQTPFSNCRFQICDLPGQCRGEGKCHHPAVPAATQSAVVLDGERDLRGEEN